MKENTDFIIALVLLYYKLVSFFQMQHEIRYSETQATACFSFQSVL